LTSDIDVLLFFQTFIDKFRYNAKRASLVQSRIKVLFIVRLAFYKSIAQKVMHMCVLFSPWLIIF